MRQFTPSTQTVNHNLLLILGDRECIGQQQKTKKDRVMSGGGSILAMVVSISNNKKLLRRKSVFEKGRKLDDPEMTTYKNRHRPIEVKHLSDSELKTIREKIKAQKKRNHRKAITISILVFSITFLTIYIGSIKISEALVSHKQSSTEEILKRNRAEFNYRIQQGDFLVSQSMFGDAIFHYKKAVELIPDSYKANARLANAYMQSCFEDYTYCDEGKRHLDKTIDLYSDDVKLLEIRASLLLAAGETEEANLDYEKINEIIEKKQQVESTVDTE